MEYNPDQEHLKALEKAYVDLIQPHKLVEHFSTDDEFREWAELGTIEDLKCTLAAFEEDELYSHCLIIKNVLALKIINDGSEEY